MLLIELFSKNRFLTAEEIKLNIPAKNESRKRRFEHTRNQKVALQIAKMGKKYLLHKANFVPMQKVLF